ncbi:MAG: P1 family peptidase [Trueperaceae bacterium]|nr:MAG: P1 family peptidase [Trueperaceae bacterium]
MTVQNRTLTAVEGLKVGHWSDPEAKTGCTVVLCPPEGCLASGVIMGSAPGSRESALLDPAKTVERIHGLVFSGGSAYGLASAGGVMRWLEEHGIGFPTPFGLVPIVPASVIYDLGVGRADVRPGEQEGYRAACEATYGVVETGAVGAGTGATIGKHLGVERAVAGGLGCAALEFQGVTVAALVVCNALGCVVDPNTGREVAGRLGTLQDLVTGFGDQSMGTNTTLIVVATDAPLAKAGANLLAQHAYYGLARVTRPTTVFDGDSAFVLSTARGPALPLAALSVAVQEVVVEAVLQGIRAVRRSGG